MLNLITDKIKTLPGTRIVDNYKKICRQQLENKFPTLSVPTTTSIPATKPKKMYK